MGFTCRNAHACVGCPAFAPLLKSCPLLGSDGIGFVGATPGEGQRATPGDSQELARVEGVGATRGNSYKRKRMSSGLAKRKSSSELTPCYRECDRLDKRKSSSELTPCYRECDLMYDDTFSDV